MAAAGKEEEARTEMEVETAAILLDLKRIVRARDRRMRRRRKEKRQLEEAVQVVPAWGRRRPRSVFEDGNKPSSAVVVGGAQRDGAASPDTPLAFPDSVPEEEEDGVTKAAAQDEWVQEQRVAVANLSQEKADLVKQIEEYRGRLLTSRSANESLKQLHKMRQQQEAEHARKKRMLALRPGTTTTAMPIPHRPVAALGLDLNVPADDEAETARAMAAQALRERYWQVQVQQFHRAAATAEARRRRLGILRAKVASPLVSYKTRRVAG